MAPLFCPPSLLKIAWMVPISYSLSLWISIGESINWKCFKSTRFSSYLFSVLFSYRTHLHHSKSSRFLFSSPRIFVSPSIYSPFPLFSSIDSLPPSHLLPLNTHCMQYLPLYCLFFFLYATPAVAMKTRLPHLVFSAINRRKQGRESVVDSKELQSHLLPPSFHAILKLLAAVRWRETYVIVGWRRRRWGKKEGRGGGSSPLSNLVTRDSLQNHRGIICCIPHCNQGEREGEITADRGEDLIGVHITLIIIFIHSSDGKEASRGVNLTKVSLQFKVFLVKRSLVSKWSISLQSFSSLSLQSQDWQLLPLIFFFKSQSVSIPSRPLISLLFFPINPLLTPLSLSI